MPFFKKLKNNIGLDEEAKKNEEELEDEESNEDDEEEFSKKTDKKKEKENRKRKEAQAEESRAMEKNAFNSLKTKGQLAVDVFQTDGEIVVQSAVAGVKPDELDISVENDVLTIKGKRERPAEKEPTNYFYQECYWGKFSREIILPAEVDLSQTKATIKEGVLTIRIPKIDKETKRKISVKE